MDTVLTGLDNEPLDWTDLEGVQEFFLWVELKMDAMHSRMLAAAAAHAQRAGLGGADTNVVKASQEQGGLDALD
jgi:hypothetical protein